MGKIEVVQGRENFWDSYSGFVVTIFMLQLDEKNKTLLFTDILVFYCMNWLYEMNKLMHQRIKGENDICLLKSSKF